MTNEEFSNTFTTLLNSYNTQANFGEQSSQREIVLDEYEKSVILTQAQDIIVKSYFDRTLNPQGQGFDDSARRQVDFSSLIKVAELEPVEEVDSNKLFDSRGVLFQMPRAEGSETGTEVLFILNEKLVQTITQNVVPQGQQPKTVVHEFVIVPISYREYDREMSKPYAQPLKKQAWRLFQNQATGFDIQSELIPRWNIKDNTDASGTPAETSAFTYKVRYVKRPRPIILEDMPENQGLDIDGETKVSSCELNPILHMDILNKAVEIAISTRGGAVPQPQQERRRE